MTIEKLINFEPDDEKLVSQEMKHFLGTFSQLAAKINELIDAFNRLEAHLLHQELLKILPKGFKERI